MQGERIFVPLSEDVVARYLATLGVMRAKPSLAALRDLVAAHLIRIPFKNISKAYYRKDRGQAKLRSDVLHWLGVGAGPE